MQERCPVALKSEAAPGRRTLRRLSSESRHDGGSQQRNIRPLGPLRPLKPWKFSKKILLAIKTVTATSAPCRYSFSSLTNGGSSAPSASSPWAACGWPRVRAKGRGAQKEIDNHGRMGRKAERELVGYVIPLQMVSAARVIFHRRPVLRFQSALFTGLIPKTPTH